jgi:hypothetical protein
MLPRLLLLLVAAAPAVAPLCSRIAIGRRRREEREPLLEGKREKKEGKIVEGSFFSLIFF